MKQTYLEWFLSQSFDVRWYIAHEYYWDCAFDMVIPFEDWLTGVKAEELMQHFRPGVRVLPKMWP